MSIAFLETLVQFSLAIVRFLQNEIFFSAVAFVFIGTIVFFLKNRSPYLHFGLWTLLLVRLVLPPDFTHEFSFSQLIHTFFPQIAFYTQAVSSAGGVPTTDYAINGIAGQELVQSTFASRSATPIRIKQREALPWQFWAFLIWLIGVLITLYLFSKSFYRFTKIIGDTAPVDKSEVINFVSRWRKLFNIRRSVGVISSEAYLSPFTTGMLKPKIFLPKPLLTKFSPEIVQAVIAHEMAHIKRFDSLWLKFQNLVQIVYFFYPLAWLACRQLNRSRESICDRMVLSHDILAPKKYAESMVEILKLNVLGGCNTGLLPAFGGDKNKFCHRINTILHGGMMKKQSTIPAIVFCLSLGWFLLPMSAGEFAMQPLRSANAEFVPRQAETKLISPMKRGRITSRFGEATDPTTNTKAFHKGVDIAAPRGTAIFAAANAVVDSAITEYVKNQGYGKKIVLSHEEALQTVYAHLDKVFVKAGQRVQAGEKIGEVGTTGKSTGPHLHFEIIENDENQNPELYLELFQEDRN